MAKRCRVCVCACVRGVFWLDGILHMLVVCNNLPQITVTLYLLLLLDLS